MKSLFVSAFVGFGVTLGAFALFADNTFWSQGAGETTAAAHEESTTLALTAEPSVQSNHEDKTAHHKAHSQHRKPQADDMSIALRPKESKKVAAKSLDLGSGSTASFQSTTVPKTGKWSVQIASYKTEADANSKLSTMKNDGFDGFVESAEVNGASVYRVKIGPVSTKTEAQALHAKITQMPGLSGSILSKSQH